MMIKMDDESVKSLHSPELEVSLQLDLSHGLELVGPGPHTQQCGCAGLLSVYCT